MIWKAGELAAANWGQRRIGDRHERIGDRHKLAGIEFIENQPLKFVPVRFCLSLCPLYTVEPKFRDVLL